MRTVSIFLTFFVLVAALVTLPNAVLAGSTSGGDVVSKITGAGNFEDKMNTGAQNIIDFLRKLGLIIAAIMLIWAGVTFAARGGNPQALMDMKGRLIAAAVGLILVFGAEPIVKFFINISGFESELNNITSKSKSN